MHGWPVEEWAVESGAADHSATIGWTVAGVVAMAVATFALGVWGARTARTTSDFLAARRLVGVERNAAAISGEYLSAASFLGIAGLVLKDGVDALWFPIGFAAGYVALLLFVAAPLRRSGAYSLPDFAEARLESLRLRWLTTAVVVLIGWMYLVPHLQGAGVVFTAVSGWPPWVGVLVVAGSVVVSVVGGGMRAVTLVQAFQYWAKIFAITLPAFALIAVFLASESPYRRGLDAPLPPTFERDTTVSIESEVRVQVVEPVWLEVTDGASEGPIGVGVVHLAPGTHTVPAGTEMRFPAGAAVPVVSDADPDNASWLQPSSDGPVGLFGTYSLIIALFLGTMGLPHVLVRYYTNPSGHTARRTTLYVVALLGTFYLFPTIFGLLSRFFVPKLLVTGETDAAVLMLPQAMIGGPLGGVLAAVTAAGAFAAFLSASTGLLAAIGGVFSTDVVRSRAVDYRLLTLFAAAVPVGLALVLPARDIAEGVGLAFAMAASTFCPLLVLGIWWRGLTAVGAASGVVAGGGLVLLAALLGVPHDDPQSWWSMMTSRPAAVTVPIAFLVSWVVSKGTAARVPPFVPSVMLRMHSPDRLGAVDDGGGDEPVGGRHRS